MDLDAEFEKIYGGGGSVRKDSPDTPDLDAEFDKAYGGEAPKPEPTWEGGDGGPATLPEGEKNQWVNIAKAVAPMALALTGAFSTPPAMLTCAPMNFILMFKGSRVQGFKGSRVQGSRICATGQTTVCPASYAFLIRSCPFASIRVTVRI